MIMSSTQRLSTLPAVVGPDAGRVCFRTRAGGRIAQTDSRAF